jgi:flavodoxin
MNSLVIYFSKFGNTRSIAEAIAERLSQHGGARAANLHEFIASDLADADLVVMGSPTHFQNLPKEVRPVLEALPKRALAGKAVAAFDTSVQTWGPLMRLTAAHRLHGKLRKLGGKPVVRPETFLVKKSEERPEGEIDLLCEGEVERAAEWASTILQAVASRAN